MFDLPIYKNEFKTKTDVKNALLAMCEPLKKILVKRVLFAPWGHWSALWRKINSNGSFFSDSLGTCTSMEKRRRNRTIRNI